MKIGIFGGAFNPVHNGHLKLIDILSSVPMKPNFASLDKFVIIPTANPPHRSDDEFVSGLDRVKMLRLAIKDNDIFNSKTNSVKLEISDIEFGMVGKSYTYNTLKALKGLYPEGEYYLFVGSDQLFAFKSWYKYEKILKLARIVVFSRKEEDIPKVKQFLEENKDINADAVFASPFDVSSSEIRAKLKNGESIEGLVPSCVEDYIKEHKLYV